MARLADKIRQADDMASEVIDVPGWNVKLEIRSMTALQRSGMQTEWAANEENTAASLYSAMLQNCCFDPDTGEKVFTEEDLTWLMEEKSAEVVEEVAQACLKVSGLSGDAVDEAGKGSSGSEETPN